MSELMSRLKRGPPREGAGRSGCACEKPHSSSCVAKKSAVDNDDLDRRRARTDGGSQEEGIAQWSSTISEQQKRRGRTPSALKFRCDPLEEECGEPLTNCSKPWAPPSKCRAAIKERSLIRGQKRNRLVQRRAMLQSEEAW